MVSERYDPTAARSRSTSRSRVWSGSFGTPTTTTDLGFQRDPWSHHEPSTQRTGDWGPSWLRRDVGGEEMERRQRAVEREATLAFGGSPTAHPWGWEGLAAPPQPRGGLAAGGRTRQGCAQGPAAPPHPSEGAATLPWARRGWPTPQGVRPTPANPWGSRSPSASPFEGEPWVPSHLRGFVGGTGGVFGHSDGGRRRWAKEEDFGVFCMGRAEYGGYGVPRGGYNTMPADRRMEKLKMPIFEGTDPDGWIVRAERYFQVMRVSEEEVLENIICYLEGQALSWYRWRMARAPFRSWEELTAFLLDRFQTKPGADFYEHQVEGRPGGAPQQEAHTTVAAALPPSGEPDDAEELEGERPPADSGESLPTEEVGWEEQVGQQGRTPEHTLESIRVPPPYEFLRRDPYLMTGGKFTVLLGDGRLEESKRMCQGLCLILQGVQIVEDFLPFELGNVDVILGVQWLKTLGDVKANGKRLRMEFQDRERIVGLTGDPSLCFSMVAFKTMSRAFRKSGEGYLVECMGVATETEGQISETPEEVQRLLEQFVDVFHMPQGLPPPREHEHAIVLREGAPPVSVRPYRYPHAQKDEIERDRHNGKVRILQEGCKSLLYMVLHARVVLDLDETFEEEIRFEQVGVRAGCTTTVVLFFDDDRDPGYIEKVRYCRWPYDGGGSMHSRVRTRRGQSYPFNPGGDRRPTWSSTVHGFPAPP